MTAFPPFRLDLTHHCLWRLDATGAEQRIDLKPKTFDVLRYLLAHRGRLVTHEELLEELWSGLDVQQEVVKSHVLSIRKVLGDLAGEPRFIQTVRRRGYQFIGPVNDEPETDPGSAFPVRLGKFVGRAEPLSALREALGRARNCAPQLVFVSGEPGVGKTALIERFLADLTDAGEVWVTIGRCIEGYGGIEPHYPVLEALTRLLRQPQADAAVQALRLIAPTWAAQLPGLVSEQALTSLPQQMYLSSRARMIREFLEFLDKLSERRALVLVLEDLHWSDYSTIDLLSAFARRRSTARALIIGTFRQGDAAAGNHPIHSLARDLGIRKIGTRLSLQPLELMAVFEFVQSAVAGADTQRLAQLLAEQANGNPFLMIATLENFIERGLLVPDGDRLALAVPFSELKVEISSDLSQVLEERIAQLDEQQQRVLAAGSVVGMVFNSATAAAASGLSAVEFEETCEKLVRDDKCIEAASLHTYPDGTVARNFAFKHVLYRRAFYERQGPVRLTLSHRNIREALERLYPAPERKDIALQLVQHCSGCAEWSQALDYLRAALLVVRIRFSYRDGLALLAVGRDLAGHLPEPERAAVECEMLEATAGIYTAIRDPRAFAAYEELACLARSLGRHDTQARALIGMTYVLGWQDVARCRTLLLEALATSRSQLNPLTRARTELSAHMGLLFLDGWDDGHDTACSNALGILAKGTDRFQAAWAAVEHSLLDSIAGRYAAAYQAVRDDFQTLLASEIIRPGLHTSRMIFNVWLVTPWVLFFSGKLGPAFADLDTHIPLLRDSGNEYSARILQLVRGWIRCQIGDYAGALEDCRAARENETPDGSAAPPLDPHEYRIYLVVCGAAEAGLGNFERAAGLFAEREQRARENPTSLDWYWRIIAEYETTQLWLYAGNADRAEAHAQLLLQLTKATRERTFQALACNALAEVRLLQKEARSALDSVRDALEIATEGQTPLASWRIYLTAARTYQRLAQTQEASSARGSGARAGEDLLQTLPERHPFHETFKARIERAVAAD